MEKHMRFTTTIGEHFPVDIDAELDSTGDIADIKVFSTETGQDVTDLIYGTFVWDSAWCKAQDFAATDSHVRAARIHAAHQWAQPRWAA